MGKECIDGCGESQYASAIKAAFKSLDYLCIDHYDEFIEHLPCFSQSHDEVREKTTSECGSESTMETLIAKQTQAKENGDIMALKNVLSCMCSYIKCTISASSEATDEVCEAEAPGEFLKDFAKSSFSALEELMSDNGLGFMWPSECSDVAAGDFEGDSSSLSCVSEL